VARTTRHTRIATSKIKPFIINDLRMEAAGIEPASENDQQENLHTYQVPIVSRPARGNLQLRRTPARWISPRTNRASSPGLSCIDRRSPKDLQAGFPGNVARCLRG